MKQALCKVARMQDCKIPNSAPTRLRVYSGLTAALLRLNSEFTPTKPKSPFSGRFRALSVIFRIMKIVDTA